jgi:hypothetical protein
MPYLENVDELAESLADAVGVWGACRDESPDGCHLWRAGCRVCWTMRIKARIRDAVQNEEKEAHVLTHPG